MVSRIKAQPASAAGTRNGDEILDLLAHAYNAEIETVANYLAIGANIDGIRAEEVRDSLQSDVPTELGHAQKLANRIRTLGGAVPGSQSLRWEQDFLQPPRRSTDLVGVIKGVIEAEQQAVDIYQSIIDDCEGNDYVTQDLAIEILADEQEHHREFVGYLREFQDHE